jgi:hypothetical protein
VALEGHETQRDGVTEKSREEGATWCVLIVEAWLARFHEWKDCFNISRNADAVDKSGNKFTLFAKLDVLFKNLPDWLGPPPRRVKFLFDFEANNSQIMGEATTEAAGVGGRASFALVDELGQIEADHAVVTYTRDVSFARQFVSTHTGQGTAFHQLCQRADAGELRRFRLHWTDNPRKNRGLYRCSPDGKLEILDKGYEFPPDYKFVLNGSPTGGLAPGVRSVWYDAEVVARGGQDSRDVKLNLDCDVAGATKQYYPPLLIESLARRGREPEWEGDLHHDPQEGTPIELVPRKGGSLQLWLAPGLDTRGRLAHVPPGLFVIGADASQGSGATPSCATVTRFEGGVGVKVARFTDAWCEPRKFGPLLVALARLFRDPDGNPAFLVWETPGVGSELTKPIYHEIGYRNVYFRTTEFQGEVKETDTPGFNTTSGDARLALHGLYRSALSSAAFVNPCAADLKECLAFVHDKGSVANPKATKTQDPSGGGLNHSDHVIADALSLFGGDRKGWLGQKKAEEERTEAEADNRSIAGRRALGTVAGRKAGMPSLWQ